MDQLTTVDLFSGIGGFARGLEATGHFRTTCFVEQDPFCQAVLKHHWPDVPVLDDIIHARQFDFPDSRPDLVCGGFPCQPFSQAGRQLAQNDPRHLWPEMLRVIRELRPTWVVGENVVGRIKLGLDEVLADLEGEGYATRTFDIPAISVGAPHLRHRIWVIAHADSESEPDGAFDGNARQRQLGFDFMAHSNGSGRDTQPLSSAISSKRQNHTDAYQSGQRRSGRIVADSKRPRTGVEEHQGEWPANRPEEWWEFEPDVGRLVDGLPNRVSQLRALGNSIVPQIAQEIGQAIRVAHDH